MTILLSEDVLLLVNIDDDSIETCLYWIWCVRALHKWTTHVFLDMCEPMNSTKKKKNKINWHTHCICLAIPCHADSESSSRAQIMNVFDSHPLIMKVHCSSFVINPWFMHICWRAPMFCESYCRIKNSNHCLPGFQELGLVNEWPTWDPNMKKRIVGSIWGSIEGIF